MGNPDDLPQTSQNRRRYGDSDSVGLGELSENSFVESEICISGTCRNVSARCFAGFLPDQTLSERARNQNDEKPEGRRAISVKDLHSMRHVFCYYAGQAGMPLSTVQSIVGHMTPEMTRHYMAHVSIKAKLPEFLIFNSTADQPENLSIRQRIAELVYSLPEDELCSILQKHEKKFLTIRG